MIAFGLALVLVGAVAIIVEAHLPAGGVVAVLGAVCAAAGVGLSISASGAGFWWTLPISVCLGVIALVLILLGAVRTRSALRAAVETGPERLIGSPASVCTWSGTSGQVSVGGGVWSAKLDPGWDVSAQPEPGEMLIIEKRDGLTLTVRPRQLWEPENS